MLRIHEVKLNKKSSKTIEEKINAFAFRIDEDNGIAEHLVKHAISLGLTYDELVLGTSGEGDYLTFGADKQYDISAVSSRRKVLKGVNIITDFYKMKEQIEIMASKKHAFDLFDEGTYRSKAVSKLDELGDNFITKLDKDLKKAVNNQSRYDTTPQQPEVELEEDLSIIETDNFVLVNDELILKNQNDHINYVVELPKPKVKKCICYGLA